MFPPAEALEAAKAATAAKGECKMCPGGEVVTLLGVVDGVEVGVDDPVGLTSGLSTTEAGGGGGVGV